MFKNMRRVKARGQIPVLVTGALHAEEIKKIAEAHGWKVVVIRPETKASAGEKWMDSQQYKKFVKKG